MTIFRKRLTKRYPWSPLFFRGVDLIQVCEEYIQKNDHPLSFTFQCMNGTHRIALSKKVYFSGDSTHQLSFDDQLYTSVEDFTSNLMTGGLHLSRIPELAAVLECNGDDPRKIAILCAYGRDA